MITVRFFGSLREQVGFAEQQISAAPEQTIAQVWQQVCPDFPRPENTLSALNQEYMDFNTPVQAGDEVAFFPPVTGG
ncbi:molybdopterin converting factor subunit 1 [Candidatus Venteria ishoeyi]|uniref:Molybdopterin synthase sulfur carrier subunit n=1 Tax=Candidatus Venteria ishoeyi TaxID=1899563 RepID=A0A1H6FG60_9GAMM|nr:molybdopterin converting factor subunit 1 [Candidatus Venteria ishoeyi]MDM8545669.1 molybdopterin converting factor subunit 1 [Candidatus Venteria ishoeyi]SEH09052.1 Molybdopterin synthase sulfur carrier subunit [Candidatus Venteria ishoeyi]